MLSQISNNWSYSARDIRALSELRRLQFGNKFTVACESAFVTRVILIYTLPPRCFFISYHTRSRCGHSHVGIGLNWEFTCSDLWHRKGQALVYLDALQSEITASMGGKTSSILYIPLHNGFLWILLRGKFVTEGPMCQYFLFASVRDRISLTINFLTKGLGNPFRQLCTMSQCPIIYMSMYNIFKHF